MTKERYIILADIGLNAETSIYDKKKLSIIQGKLRRIFGVVSKEFDDISNEYKYDLVNSMLLNLFLMIGILQSDKEKFISHMSSIYDFATESENEGKVELVEDL